MKLNTTSTGVDVTGTITTDGFEHRTGDNQTLIIGNSGSYAGGEYGRVMFKEGSTELAYLQWNGTGNEFKLINGIDGPLTLGTNNAERLKINGDGTWAKAPAGTIMQVVSANYSTISTTSLSTTGPTDMPFYVDITPKSTSSRIFITAHVTGEFNAQSHIYNTPVAFKRGSTFLANSNGTAKGITTFLISYESSDADSTLEACSYQYWDAPATTSSVRYRCAFGQTSNSNGNFLFNRVRNSSTATGYERGICNITVMEIAQ